MAKTALDPVKLRNTARAQWFFEFEVSDAIAAQIREARDGRGIVGLKVERGTRRKNKSGKPVDVSVPICTMAIGDREAVPDKEILPELTIPGEVWAALMGEKQNASTIRGLVDSGEIAITSGAAFAA